MKFFVYILFSETQRRTYTGQTEDVAARVARHNAGRVRSTKAYRPWVLLHTEGFMTRGEAMQRERWLKGKEGRRFIAGLIERWYSGGGLSVWVV
jgi:putative endonuclease